MFGTEDIPGLEAQIEQHRAAIKVQEAGIRGLLLLAKQMSTGLRAYFTPLLTANTARVTAVRQAAPVENVAAWDTPEWGAWTPTIWGLDSGGSSGGQGAAMTPALPKVLRVGELIEARTNGDPKFGIPAFAPFLGQNRTLMIETDAQNAAQGLALLQSLVVRTALLLPHQATFVLLDPAGNGAAFPMRRHLSNVRENSGDVRRDLERVIQEIQRINEGYLDAASPSFEQVDAQKRMSERFQLIFAADFPNKYDRRAIEALQSVAATGPRTGAYVFIQHNRAIEMPRDLSMNDFGNATLIAPGTVHKQGSYSLKFVPDMAPSAALQDTLLGSVRLSKPPERKIGTDLIVPKGAWWTCDSSHMIETPIGAWGASGTLDLWFGENDKGNVCAHGMLGAMTGAGKSNLYHVLILGLCMRYSPNELRLFLIDGKDGVEFQPYRDLPHAEVVSLKSSPQLSRSVLAELVAERERRNQIFTECHVSDLTQYRALAQPRGVLPRILLLVDEYQELFEGDRDGVASALLLQLAQQGRSAGIHMLLGSQRFGAPGMLNQTSIFGNFHLRMAMQMTAADTQSLSEFGRKGKQLVANCDLPGKIVVNDRSGDDGGNRDGKVAYLSSPFRQEVLAQLTVKAQAELAPEQIPLTVVFDGKAQPNFVENPYINYLLNQPGWLSTAEFQTMARRPIHDGGLNVVDWFAAETPTVFWMGQDFSVRGEAAAIVRRRTSENVLIVGGANPARYGVLAGMLASFALNYPPAHGALMVMDRSVAGTAWSTTLEDTVNTVFRPAGYQVEFTRETKEAEVFLDRVLAEMDGRGALTEEQLGAKAPVLVVMTELDRVEDLRRRADTYGMRDSPLGQKLNRICIEGPALGVHLILSFGGVRPMSHVIDERRTLLNFRHRVALQMSEDESLTFVRSRKAAQLQAEGPTPLCALYLDMENDQTLRFKPYSIEATIPFADQLRAVGDRIQSWVAQQQLAPEERLA